MRRTSLVLLAVAACGGDDAVPEMPNGPGRFDAPADFDRSGCQAGAFADGGLQGLYHFTIDYGDGFPATQAMRFDELDGGEFGGTVTGQDAQRAWGSDDEMFVWRHAGTLDDDQSRSVLFCKRDGDTVSGQFAHCTADECFLGAATGTRVEPLDEAEASGFTELGSLSRPEWHEQRGVGLQVRVDGDTAYLIRQFDGMRIIDIRNPAAPVELAHVPCEFPDVNEIYNDVKIVHVGNLTYALVASSRVGIVVVDVTNPAAPQRLGSFGSQGETYEVIHTLAVAGTRAYLANLELGLEIWDIADPRAPVKLGGFYPASAPDGAFLHDLYVEGDRAYLNFWSAGMIIADVSNPAAPVEIGRFESYGEHSSHSSWVTDVGGKRVAGHGDEQWGSHLRLVDVTENTPGFGTQLGEWQTRPEVSAHNIMAVGTTIIMSHYQDGIRAIDISDPARPVTRAWFNTWKGYDRAYGYSFFEGAIGVDLDVARQRVYVADSHRDLVILSVDSSTLATR